MKKMILTTAALALTTGIFAEETTENLSTVEETVNKAFEVEKEANSGAYFPFVGGGLYKINVDASNENGTVKGSVEQQAALLGTSYRAKSGYTFDLTWFISNLNLKSTVESPTSIERIDETAIIPNFLPEMMFGYTKYANESNVNTPYLSGSAGLHGIIPSAAVRGGYQLENGFVDIGAHVLPAYGVAPEIRAGIKF